MLYAQDSKPVAEQPKIVNQQWLDPGNRIIAHISKHTNHRGQARATLVFLLRDENARGLAIGLPGSEALRVFFRGQLQHELARMLKDHRLEPSQIDKLNLAGELDIVRFLRKSQVIERQLSQIDFETGLPAANKLIAPLTKICESGLFNQDSLYAQVLAGCQSDE